MSITHISSGRWSQYIGLRINSAASPWATVGKSLPSPGRVFLHNEMSEGLPSIDTLGAGASHVGRAQEQPQLKREEAQGYFLVVFFFAKFWLSPSAAWALNGRAEPGLYEMGPILVSCCPVSERWGHCDTQWELPARA